MNPSSTGHTSVLWTGGWDSTFRILQLLLEHRAPVAPVYLIDTERPSAGIEIRTMRMIKERLFAEHPHTQTLLQPTSYMEAADISEDAEITGAYQRIKAVTWIGWQYDWLPRYCRQSGTDTIELCVHRDDKAHLATEPFITTEETETGKTWRVRDDASADQQLVFGHYRFPLYCLTKQEMAASAEQNGWMPYMSLTWFCHKPRGDAPCGRCNPCRYTAEEGMGWRIPRRRRVEAALRRTRAVKTASYYIGRVPSKLRQLTALRQPETH